MADVFVIGSINQDFVLTVERRPEPGETVTDARLSEGNGGKGANQAAAAALLGAQVAFLGRVGDDGFGGALAASLARDDSLESAVAYAVRAGAAAATREGAQGALPTTDIVEAL